MYHGVIIGIERVLFLCIFTWQEDKVVWKTLSGARWKSEYQDLVCYGVSQFLRVDFDESFIRQNVTYCVDMNKKKKKKMLAGNSMVRVCL